MESYRIGICAGPGDVARAAATGYDYIELDLNEVLPMDEDGYRAMARAMGENNIYAEVVYGMLPPGLPIVGPEVSARHLHEALDRSFDMAQALGAEQILFDCESARVTPAHFEPALAWRQLGNFIRILQSYAAKFDLKVALLPLRRSAVELMNYVSEAALISAMLQLDRVGVAASSYNMAMEAESLHQLKRTGSLLWHMRTSNSLGNRPPQAGDGEAYRKLFEALREMNYTGRVSCEARCANFETEAAEALRCLREASV